jgi:hypothetical protein
MFHEISTRALRIQVIALMMEKWWPPTVRFVLLVVDGSAAEGLSHNWSAIHLKFLKAINRVIPGEIPPKLDSYPQMLGTIPASDSNKNVAAMTGSKHRRHKYCLLEFFWVADPFCFSVGQTLDFIIYL